MCDMHETLCTIVLDRKIWVLMLDVASFVKRPLFILLQCFAVIQLVTV